jgi:flagellar basal-body rod protein FlgG
MLPRYYKLISVSNNMANATTTSFKVDRRYFSTVLNNELTQEGAPNRAERLEDLDEGLYTDYRQGALRATGRQTDLAINGDGFFVVEDPESRERFYTRDGRFQISAERELITPKGDRVLDDGYAPIEIEEDEFFVDEHGGIYVAGRHNTDLALVTFDDKTNLIKKGDNLYGLEIPADPKIAEEATAHQGMLETSNVNVVEEMVQMIMLNRNYESAQRALTSQDQSLAKLIQQVPQF